MYTKEQVKIKYTHIARFFFYSFQLLSSGVFIWQPKLLLKDKHREGFPSGDTKANGNNTPSAYWKLASYGGLRAWVCVSILKSLSGYGKNNTWLHGVTPAVIGIISVVFTVRKEPGAARTNTNNNQHSRSKPEVVWLQTPGWKTQTHVRTHTHIAGRVQNTTSHLEWGNAERRCSVIILTCCVIFLSPNTQYTHTNFP